MDEEGCGCLIGLGLLGGALYIIVMIVAVVAAVAVSVFTAVIIVSILAGALYGVYVSALNYVEALNQTFGERFK